MFIVFVVVRSGAYRDMWSGTKFDFLIKISSFGFRLRLLKLIENVELLYHVTMTANFCLR